MMRDDQPVGHGGAAGQRQAPQPHDLYQAHPANPDRLHPLVPAEPGDVDAVVLGDLDDELGGRGLHLDAVDRHLHAAWHLPSFTWARTSSRKNLLRLTTAETADGPSGQIVVCENGALRPGEMLSPTSRRRSRSVTRPSPYSIRYRTFWIQPVPSRQGVHLPQLSWAKNLASRRATRTGQTSWL